MAAVAGECDCFQLIPCNLFLPPFSSLPYFLGSIFAGAKMVFNLVAGAGRLRLEALEPRVDAIFLGGFVVTCGGLDSKGGLSPPPRGPERGRGLQVPHSESGELQEQRQMTAPGGSAERSLAGLAPYHVCPTCPELCGLPAALSFPAPGPPGPVLYGTCLLRLLFWPSSPRPGGADFPWQTFHSSWSLVGG